MKHTPKESAVSPVIGVILMVAITVILAAVIAAFVFGAAGNIQKTKTVAATVQQNENDISVTYQGGTDDSSLSYMNITLPKSTTCAGVYTTADMAGGTIATGGLVEDDATAAEKPNVGAVYILEDCGTTGRDRLVITGRFTDGSDQVILDTTV